MPAPRSGRPTLKDVAHAAGVSTATVSYVLNGRTDGRASRVSTEVTHRILEAVRELQYVPNAAARGLRKERTEQVGVVTRWADSAWARLVMESVASVASTQGYSTLMFNAGDWRRFLLGGVVDGAVVDLSAVGSEDADALSTIAAQRVGLVVMSNELEPFGFDVVRSTESEASLAAMRHLIERGHTRIACLRRRGDDDSGGIANLRLRAYRQAMAEAGLQIHPDDELVTGGSWPRAYDTAQRLLALEDRPTAVFSLDEAGAYASLWAAQARGMRIPDDLAIVGIGLGLVSSPDEATELSRVVPLGDDATNEIAELLFSRVASPQRSDRIMTQRWDFLPGATT